MEGGCYCGALRYRVEAKPLLKAQCHCRECQYISGGGPNYYMVMPEGSLHYTKGSPARFSRADLDAPVTREFCAVCGTHILTLRTDMPFTILKIGTLDAPEVEYRAPKMAIYTKDKQDWHIIPQDMPCFEGLPPRR